jgi:hypothetical protein
MYFEAWDLDSTCNFSFTFVYIFMGSDGATGLGFGRPRSLVSGKYCVRERERHMCQDLKRSLYQGTLDGNLQTRLLVDSFTSFLGIFSCLYAYAGSSITFLMQVHAQLYQASLFCGAHPFNQLRPLSKSPPSASSAATHHSSPYPPLPSIPFSALIISASVRLF